MFSLAQILEWSAGRLVNGEDWKEDARTFHVSKLAPLRGSSRTDLSFFFSKDYQEEIPLAQPGVLITGEAFVGPLKESRLPIWSRSAIIACQDPYLVMARLSAKFAGLGEFDERGSLARGIHPTAVVHPSARIASSASIGPNCVIERGASIGENSSLVAGVFLGAGSSVGEDSILFPNVTVYHQCRIGSRVRLHSGVVVGSDGFGYAPERVNGKTISHQKIHHLGGVVIGNDVEIGASTAIDRGTLEDTVIEDLVKIDNLVQVAHNSLIRKGAILCGMSGVAGGSVVGRFAYLGGRAIVINKAEVGDESMLAADCVVTKDVPAGAQVAGSPHRPLRDYLKIQARLGRLVDQAREKKGDAT
ncbi:MAG: UDP-3-O-(3-hydroxymyristoyl)glucosamine N-acyltransferase [Bdellovibrionales bacterium]|nr:UDP-3-O-(3-hydroxymyristoyl)glucosamine N-acyltransferase [Bdellovibrionales bacterium]